MCGIVGAISKQNIVQSLLEGLVRLEYRGYDSAGLVTLNAAGDFQTARTVGKVRKLIQFLDQHPAPGTIGLAHTRWATHGEPSEINAHPHIVNNEIAIVHNGIIENYIELKNELSQDDCQFASQTDTEIIAHLICKYLNKFQDLLKAVQATIKKLHGAFALGILSKSNPNRIIAVRIGSPLVLGLGKDENFIASDHLALSSVTDRFIYLEDGDIADLKTDEIDIYDVGLHKVQRPIKILKADHGSSEKGEYKHFMQKEIFTQAEAINNTLEGRLTQTTILPEIFGQHALEFFSKTDHLQIVACGTSYHAGLTATYWLEKLAKIACHVEIASEFRYRENVVLPNTLFITISQSGETADTLAALRKAKQQQYINTLAICNVPESSLVRESGLAFITHAGPEIGVASTKAFTAQLTALLMLTIVFKKIRNVDTISEQLLLEHLRKVPHLINEVLQKDNEIKNLAKKFVNKNNAFFLGRGCFYPIALEGALKLKEISYIHAEGYAAGELKHGPLALIDKDVPVIILAPDDHLLSKIKSNLQEVKARGGQLLVFTSNANEISVEDNIEIIEMPVVEEIIAPIIYTIALQLLAYHVAEQKGTDVDQPRNLAKSVTVE